MNAITLNKTFRDDDTGPERWATYHWGELSISEYGGVSWRGLDFRVETADNPFGFFAKLDNAVMVLDRYEITDRPFAPHEDLEWWSTQQPGLLIGLEVTADGEIHAKVWTGMLELSDRRLDRTVRTLPQQALLHYRDIVLWANSEPWIRELTTMIGPVGYVTELQTPPDSEASEPGFDDDFWSEALT